MRKMNIYFVGIIHADGTREIKYHCAGEVEALFEAQRLEDKYINETVYIRQVKL